jgi:HPt (histidine-containing phosphotransfer) domain-containing protein
MQSLQSVFRPRSRAFNAARSGMPASRIHVRVASELQPLIPRFLANRRTEIASLERAVAARDADTLRRIAHSLKGVGGGYGFDEITRLGAQLESYAKVGNAAGTRRSIRALKRYLDRVEVSFD